MFLPKINHIGDGASETNEAENDRHDHHAKVQVKFHISEGKIS
jgi:hypothetical protein